MSDTSTYQDLTTQYNTLDAQIKSIQDQINSTLNDINSIGSQMNNLLKQINDMQINISQMPSAVYTTECGGGFLGMGKSCQDVPSPNPDVAGAVSNMNSLISQRNNLQGTVDSKYQQVTNLANQATSLKAQQSAIRDQLINLEQGFIAQPEGALHSLKLILGLEKPESFITIPVTTTTSKTQEFINKISDVFKKTESADWKKYFPYIATLGVTAIVILLLTGRSQRNA